MTLYIFCHAKIRLRKNYGVEMVRFRTIKQEFTSVPNDVIQGFYLSANALAVLVTCLSYPNDWKYRPVSIWKNLKLSRDKTYAAFDELVEKGHCIRIRSLRGNLRAEVDYIFFDQIITCQDYIKENEKELSASNIQVEHKWNFKKCFRHPEPWNPEGGEPEGQEVLNKIEQRRSIKESIRPIVHNSSQPKDSPPSAPPPTPPPPKKPSQDSTNSIPSYSEGFSIDFSSPELLELIEMEPEYAPFFRPEIVTRWIKIYSQKTVLETVKFFFQVKSKQAKPIPKPEAWMEVALKKKFTEVDKSTKENKEFAENLKKKYRLQSLKINKRYCQDTETGKDYYYYLPPEVFQRALQQLIE